MTVQTRTASGRVEIAGTTVSRVGFGAARLTAGDGWGAPKDPAAARNLLLAAIDAGYDYVDTADSLGPGVSEQIIGDAVGNRSDVLVATKVGMLRPSPTVFSILGRPDYLRQQIHLSLQRLRRDRIELLYLHRIDPDYPLADQLGVLQEARDRGDVGAIGISEPTLIQLEEAAALEPALAAVQSLYNPVARANTTVATRSRELNIPFVAYWPLVGRGLQQAHKAQLFEEFRIIGDKVGLSPHQLSLSWIFTTQPESLAVAGSRSISHLVQNLVAADILLDGCIAAEVSQAVERVIGDVTFNPKFPKEEQ